MLVAVTSAHARAPINRLEGVVTKVSDGDTLQVTDAFGTKVKIRLYGIDAPEIKKVSPKTGTVTKPGQPYGEEAYALLKTKTYGQRVRADVMGLDRYWRSVSVVWIGMRNINLEMVQDGSAWAYRDYLNSHNASDYIAAEAQATAMKRGLWRQDNPEPPWEFRKKLRKGRSFKGPRNCR